MDKKGETALMKAGILNDKTTVQLLLEAGAHILDTPDTTVLIYAVEHRADQGLIRSLIRAGADVNAMDKKGKTALMKAAILNDKATTELLFKTGAHINKYNCKGQCN